MAIHVTFDLDEAVFVLEQLQRHLQIVENELVHTDSHRMQHDLASDLERLRRMASRLERVIAEEREGARVSAPLAP